MYTMPKYLIEGNIDFYSELHKCEDVNDSSQQQIHDTGSHEKDVCLITQQPLTENHITLECNHKFNYNAIFYDIMNHKKKFNTMERKMLSSKEIRCPYCRNIQKTLLPYVEGYPKIHGINYLNPEHVSCYSSKNGYSPGKCCYKDNECGSCTAVLTKLLVTDNNYYCYLHYSQVIRKMIKEKEAKIKEEKIKLKIAAIKKKQEDKQKKVDEKNALKQQKQNEKQALGKCSALIKSGPNKGNPCGCCVIPTGDGLCNRHYKLLHPPVVETSTNA